MDLSSSRDIELLDIAKSESPSSAAVVRSEVLRRMKTGGVMSEPLLCALAYVGVAGDREYVLGIVQDALQRLGRQQVFSWSEQAVYSQAFSTAGALGATDCFVDDIREVVISVLEEHCVDEVVLAAVLSLESSLVKKEVACNVCATIVCEAADPLLRCTAYLALLKLEKRPFVSFSIKIPDVPVGDIDMSWVRSFL